ncbi:hypothetical protein HPB50_017771 [Hyalomma asiaticum]|uniref:Uncharacterized protein n=1 Tax=Hyalomma asiaticum TaxID=266040 RepID=A0ACB7TJV7_HYAAI|nr:hypothetical protein HPB50_017771 [Hyalomma asiaticum]
MPHANQTAYQQSSGYPSSRSYGTAHMGASGYPMNGGANYTAGWTNSAAAAADKQSKSPWAAYQQTTGPWASRCLSPQNADPGRQNYYYSNRYISRGGYPSGYGVSTVSTPAGYQTQTYGQGYSQPGVYQVQYRYPPGR